MLDEIYAEVEKMMNNAMEALIRDLSGVRTGRASTSLVDGIRIDYYGSSTPLNQLASISAPEPRLLMIKPYEQTLIGDIEKAILSDKSLGLNPSNDGQVIRLPIPELTEERRIEMTKIARHRAEEARVAIRQARREGLDLVDDAKKGAIERKRREDQLKEELRMAKKMGSPVDAIVRRAKALDDPDGGLFLPAATDDDPIVSPVLAAGGGSSSSPKRSLDPVPSIEKKKKEHLLESAQQKSRKLEELATQKALELRDDPPLDTETNVDQQANLSSLYLDAIIGQLSALEAVK